MKKLILILVVVCLALAGAALLLPVTREAFSWRGTQARNTIAACETYLKAWPKGRHVPEARALLDDLTWTAVKAGQSLNGYWRYVQTCPDGRHVDEAKRLIEQYDWDVTVRANKLAGFETFLKSHPDGQFAAEARARLEELRWAQAKSVNNIRLLRAYREMYPQGKHVTEAQRQEATLRLDEKPLQTALAAQTEQALRNFLKDFPDHPQATEALQAIKDLTVGRDIQELVADKKIEAYGSGAGFRSIQVRLQKRTPGALTIRIPAGSYFAAENSSAQNMIATSEAIIRVTDELWKQVSVPTVSANFGKSEPDHADTFKITHVPLKSPVAGLVPVLVRSGTNFPAWQAAVWIVTDNVTYENLGVLTMHPMESLLENIRLINETDTARALKWCDEAGIDLTKRKIWKKSRAEILRGLKDPDLKSWLEAKP